jgi:hypothetical protein
MPSITCANCGGRLLFDTTEGMTYEQRTTFVCSDTEACAERSRHSDTERKAKRLWSPRGFVEVYERGVWERSNNRVAMRGTKTPELTARNVNGKMVKP